MIKPLVKFIVALNSNVSKTQIAAAFAWGLWLGLFPSGNLLWIALFVISFFFKIHFPSELLLIAVLKLISPVITPFTDAIGWTILTLPALQALFTQLYNMPVAPFARFYNTLVAGGFCIGAVLWIPVFFLMQNLIPVYRKTLAPIIASSPIIIAIKKLPLLSPIIRIVGGMSRAGN